MIRPSTPSNWAELLFLTPSGLNQAAFDRVFSRLWERQLDDADLYFQFSRAESWSLEEGIVKSGSFGIEQGVGVRAIQGEKTAFAYSDEISLDALLKAAETTRAIGAAGGTHTSAIKRPVMPSTLPHQLYGMADPLASLNEAQKVALLEHFEQKSFALDSRVIRVSASLSGEWEVVLIVRSDGQQVADVRPLVRLGIHVIVEHNGRREQGGSGFGARHDYSLFDEAALTLHADLAVNQALTALEAQPAPAGEMPVVLGNGWSGVLLHEAVGHGLEGDFNRKGSSVFSGRIGERVAAKGVTVVDDGTLEGRRGSLNVDDEGTPTSRTVLIEDGILKGYLQDRMNARLMKQPLTGNGRRQSFAHLPMPRMTNTFMLNGNTEPEEIIASVKKGLYVKNLGGGQVDITNGKFVFSASEAWMIENGQLSYPVKGATLIGNGPDILTRVSLVGNDLALDRGVGICGKEGQSVPVGVGQPTLKIETGLTVGGTA